MFIKSLGGCGVVSCRIGKGYTTVHSAMRAGVFPATWFDALCDLARELGIPEPPRSLFSFVELLPVQKDDAA
ncbi:hypothetical protein [uncultured Maritimibacter sp.]|uniref:hypothetical protein n=1 Tax=uncultured Maritimibacter sp. TaxID=991866 RepID=UPI00260D270C|nr:hypothetical protein [uncultured Maritimibacter sp.]